MVFLFQNMRILLLCCQICTPNHVQVKLSVGLLNWWLGSYSIQPLIQNTINSLDYMSLLLIERTTGSVLFDLVLLVSCSAYLQFCEQSRLACSKIPSIQRKFHWRLYYCVRFLLFHCLPRYQQSTLVRVNNKTVFLHDFFLYFRFHISQIFKIRTENWA